eukprot:3564080-Lingulodinium_polyedra.AAC.1
MGALLAEPGQLGVQEALDLGDGPVEGDGHRAIRVGHDLQDLLEEQVLTSLATEAHYPADLQVHGLVELHEEAVLVLQGAHEALGSGARL